MARVDVRASCVIDAPTPRRAHHLDNAATSHPKPSSVLDALTRCAAMPGNPGRGVSTTSLAATHALEAGRAAIARFLGCSEPRRLAFTLNATDALNVALRSLAPGRTVVVTALEHAAVMRPLRRMASEGSVRIASVAPSADGTLDPGAVLSASVGASLVVLTCASNVAGAAQPVDEIAAALAPSGTPLLLDAAQAAGSLPLDFDALGPHVALAFTGHKALMGPMGCGGLLVGDALEVRSLREGGTGDSGELQPTQMPQRLEAGTPPLPAIAGLAAGVAWWLAQDPEEVRARESSLLRRMVEGIAPLPGLRLVGIDPADLARPRAPLACFRLDGWMPDELATVLEVEHDVVVRSGMHCSPDAHAHYGTRPDGAVRASIGPTTAAEDVDALVDALRRLSAS